MVKPLLTPIPVAGPFDRVGVDVISFPKSRRGNSYAVVFVDYLTKWPEVFPVADQTALTIARLLVTKIIPQHGVPSQLLSDRGSAFLSSLMFEIYRLMGIKKLNTTAYHPQTDGLVERFNRTLSDMLAKTVATGGRDWDDYLPYVLFAYRASPQESTGESPFFLLYGRDPQLPIDEVLQPPRERTEIDIEDYTGEIVARMTEAWELARKSVRKAQSRQKRQHDKRARPTKFHPGQRVFVFMPAAAQGKTRKFARPYYGPYGVKEASEQGVVVQPIDNPRGKEIRVSLARVRCCPTQLGDEFWPKKVKQPTTEPNPESGNDLEPPPTSVWAGRLRNRSGTP